MEAFAELFPMIGALAVTGALAGLGAGLFGIGGGAIIVPALFYTFTALGYDPSTLTHMAVATSAAVIIVNAVRSVRAHDALGNVDWALLWPSNPLKSYALWIGAGSFFASLLLAPRFSGAQLTGLFAFLAALISLQFIFGRPSWTLRKDVPGGAAQPIVGGSVGVLSALIGIGGGSLTVPLMSMCGLSIHRAIGTASGFGLAIALPATVGYIISGWSVALRAPFSLGYVNIPAFIFVTLAAFLFIPMGAKLAARLPQAKLKRVFGLLLLVVALNMARKTFF